MTKYVYVALATKVLVVAVINENDWAAYCDAVSGQNHENEFMEVARTGCKISETLARNIFREFKLIKYRH